VVRDDDIDGLDASSEMLRACRQKTTSKSSQPRLYQQFLHELKLERRYKLVLIPAGSFGLITNHDQVRESLKRIFTVLESEGKLVLSVDLVTQTKSQNSGTWGGRWLKRPDGALMVLSWLPTYDAQLQIGKSLLRYEVFRDGNLTETELEEFDLRSYKNGELEQLLTETGFVNLKTLTMNSKLPAEDIDQELTIECTRP
jgi:hypothetical protein